MDSQTDTIIAFAVLFGVPFIVVPLVMWLSKKMGGCNCGAPDWIQFGIFVEHSESCPQHPLNRGKKVKYG